MAKTGAELLTESLVEAGVNHLFSLSGNQILSVYDATIGRDLEVIHTRHEAAAVHMADGWGRLTGEPGVALLTAGPGHCNAISALYVALMAESPMVLLSGHSPRALIGQGAFQEMDQVAIARPVTKAAWLAEDPDRLDQDIADALSLARAGRAGPVHLSLPDDVLRETTSTPSPAPPAARAGSEKMRLKASRINQILDRLARAERPLILAGPAMARLEPWQEVEELSKITSIPALPLESPRGVDDPWLHRAADYLADADLVLLIGKKLDFSLKFGETPFFSDECRFVQIDADKEQLRRGRRVSLSVRGDPRQAVQLLIAAAQEREWPSQFWRIETLAARCDTPLEWEHLRHAPQQPIHPLRVCQALQGFIDDNAVFISDGGEFGQWIQAGVEAPSRLINGPSGAIGSALPMALAARLAHPDRRVLAALGDGTFGYHALEFDTARRYGLPIVAIVGNDARWNAEHQLQLQHYGPDRLVGCDLLPTRYDQVARALGGHGEFVLHPDELVPALERAVAADLPACVNIAIEAVKAPTFRLPAAGH